MTENMKNALAGVVMVFLLLTAWALIVYVRAYSQSIQPSSFRSFAATAEGKAVGIPDVAQFSFGVTTEGSNDIATLQKENTDKVNRAIAFVKESGVEEKDIKTEQYSLEPRYQYYSCPKAGGACPPADIVGYTVRQSVSVKVRDFTKTGNILGGVIGKGANSVSQLQFKVDDVRTLEDAARAEAIQKAQQRAELIARAGGFNVGRLLSIDEGGFTPPFAYMEKSYAMGGGNADMALAPVLVEPGSQDVKVIVTLRYEIQ